MTSRFYRASTLAISQGSHPQQGNQQYATRISVHTTPGYNESAYHRGEDNSCAGDAMVRKWMDWDCKSGSHWRWQRWWLANTHNAKLKRLRVRTSISAIHSSSSNTRLPTFSFLSDTNGSSHTTSSSKHASADSTVTAGAGRSARTRCGLKSRRSSTKWLRRCEYLTSTHREPARLSESFSGSSSIQCVARGPQSSHALAPADARGSAASARSVRRRATKMIRLPWSAWKKTSKARISSSGLLLNGNAAREGLPDAWWAPESGAGWDNRMSICCPLSRLGSLSKETVWRVGAASLSAPGEVSLQSSSSKVSRRANASVSRDKKVTTAL